MDGWKKEKKEGSKCVFNDALNTFYLQLFVIGHMVKDHSDSKTQNLLLLIHGWMDGRKQGRKQGKKEGNVYLTTHSHILFMVIWHRTYGKRPLR